MPPASSMSSPRPTARSGRSPVPAHRPPVSAVNMDAQEAGSAPPPAGLADPRGIRPQVTLGVTTGVPRGKGVGPLGIRPISSGGSRAYVALASNDDGQPHDPRRRR